MNYIRTKLNGLASKKHADLVFVLIIFLFLRLLSAFVFYNGFIINFKKIASLFENDVVNKILLYVPYHSVSILLGALLHPFFLIALIVFTIPVIINYKIIRLFEVDRTDKLIIVFSAFILSWELCTYNYNYYLNSGFYFDRLLLIIFPFLIWRLPLLAPFYIAFALVYRSQFNYPVDGFELFDKRLLFDVIIMFTSFTYIRIYIPHSKIKFIYLVLCIIASGYFATGVAKLAISPNGYEWLLDNKVSDLFLNVHARGWLANASDETISSIYFFLNKYNTIFQFIVLLIELSAIFLLRNIKTAMFLLISFCFMHLAIFAVGSMLFWKWMAIDVLMAYLLFKKQHELKSILFSKSSFITSVFIVITSFIWLRPYAIGWFDTRANQFFTYEIENGNGEIIEINKNDFNPYHQWIQYDRFTFLSDTKLLPISGFGYTGNYYFKQVIDSFPLKYISILKDKLGVNHYDSIKKKSFDDFIRVFFNNRNKSKIKNEWWTYLKPPHHLNNSVKNSNGLQDVETVKKLRVILNTSYISGNKSVILSKSIIDEIII